MQNAPGAVDLYIVDPKMIDYADFRPAAVMYADSAAGAGRVLKEVQGRMMARYSAMQTGKGCFYS